MYNKLPDETHNTFKAKMISVILKRMVTFLQINSSNHELIEQLRENIPSLPSNFMHEFNQVKAYDSNTEHRQCTTELSKVIQLVVYRGSQTKLLAFFSIECLRNLFLFYYESFYLTGYYNQKKPGSDEDIISCQRNYFLRLSQMLDLCKLLDPSHPKIDDLIQMTRVRRAEIDGCK